MNKPSTAAAMSTLRAREGIMRRADQRIQQVEGKL